MYTFYTVLCKLSILSSSVWSRYRDTLSTIEPTILIEINVNFNLFKLKPFYIYTVILIGVLMAFVLIPYLVRVLQMNFVVSGHMANYNFHFSFASNRQVNESYNWSVPNQVSSV